MGADECAVDGPPRDLGVDRQRDVVALPVAARLDALEVCGDPRVGQESLERDGDRGRGRNAVPRVAARIDRNALPAVIGYRAEGGILRAREHVGADEQDLATLLHAPAAGQVHVGMELTLREVQVALERVALGLARSVGAGLEARVHELELGGGPQRLLDDLLRIVKARQCLRSRVAGREEHREEDGGQQEDAGKGHVRRSR